VGEHLRKGHPTYLEGRLQTRKWKDKEGREQHTTEVVERMQILGNVDGHGEAPRPDKRGIGLCHAGTRAAPWKTAESMWEEIRKDIPF